MSQPKYIAKPNRSHVYISYHCTLLRQCFLPLMLLTECWLVLRMQKKILHCLVIAFDIFQKRSYTGCDNSKKFQGRTLPLPPISPLSSNRGAEFYFSHYCSQDWGEMALVVLEEQEK